MKNGEYASRAQRTYTGGGDQFDYSDDIDSILVRRFHEEWSMLEDEITNLQNTKKQMLSVIRTRFGRHQAEALKLTMRAMAMEPLKRAEHFHFNETARRYVEMIDAPEYAQ